MGVDPVDDRYLSRQVEAALGRMSRGRKRAQSSESFDDGDESNAALARPAVEGDEDAGPSGDDSEADAVRSRLALLRPTANVARSIAERLEAFED